MPDVASSRDSRFAARVLAVAAAGLILGAMVNLKPVQSVNDASRWDMVWALVEGRGYVIDGAPYETGDKVFLDGHFYSSKPALLPTVVAGLAWAVRATTGMALPDHDRFLIPWLLTLINILPFAALIVLYEDLLARLHVGAKARLYCVAAAAFGTFLTPYSTVFNNHTIAAWASFFALYAWAREALEGESAPRRWPFLGGLCAGWAAINEVTAALLLLLLLAWMTVSRPVRRWIWFLIPAAAMGIAFLLTTRLSTGRWTPFSIQLDRSLYLYEGSSWISPEGTDALREPKWFYFYNLLIGHHGILSLSPIFVIAFLGLFRRPLIPGFRVISLGLSAAVIIFYGLSTNNYGGGCIGMRWTFWLIPLWLVNLGPVVEGHWDSRLFRWAASLALLISVLSVGFALGGPWGDGRDSWMQLLMRAAELIDY